MFFFNLQKKMETSLKQFSNSIVGCILILYIKYMRMKWNLKIIKPRQDIYQIYHQLLSVAAVSGRKLLQKHNIYLVYVYYRSYIFHICSPIRIYRILRRFYHFRSVNRTTLWYACMIPVELLEQSIALYNNSSF
jgi:hypothetical protein